MIESTLTRRSVIGHAVAGAGLITSLGAAHAQAAPKTFVLVHGGWVGGWYWRRVTDQLQAKGHRVYAPTLTGLGERSHLMSALITLDTHIADVVNVIKWEDLNNIVLVGHSYAGFVISGVAERALHSIGSIVFVDAFLPENGQRLIDLGRPELGAITLTAAERNEVSRPVPPAKSFGVNEKDQPWVDAKMTPQPTLVSLQPIALSGARDKVAKKTYIRATANPQATFEGHFQRVKSDPSWRTYGVPCGHLIMVDMPDPWSICLTDSSRYC
jgi:pimeloyl-ACP methyl ester carboxylesterase